ncbi:AraC family transcriptional regulator [Azotosporobacter soli]|uniref:AraC family transcriptional regulator n=1 Tax=Azotosporobacter soli TaxID=3055040 RepID=UPI0031FF2EF5
MLIQTCTLTLASDRRELKVRGTPMFPCGAYLSQIGHHTPDLPWHWHEELEVLVVCSGILRISLPGMTFTLEQGDGAFINSNILHSAQLAAASDADCTLASLVFHPNLITGAAESIFEQRYIRPLLDCRLLPGVPFYSKTEWHAEAVQCIRAAYEAYAAESFGYEFLVRENLSRLSYLLVTTLQSVLLQQRSENPDTLRIKSMLDFLHQHYAEPLELSQIAAAASISSRECLRCFKKNIGLAPIQYLLKHRVSLAARLLTDTAAPITEICSRTGFDSPSYFAKTFKRFLDITPTAYRKQQQKN